MPLHFMHLGKDRGPSRGFSRMRSLRKLNVQSLVQCVYQFDGRFIQF